MPDGEFFNWLLSNVLPKVIEKGVDSSRLEAQGFGEDKPMASNDTPSGRKSNRRVQLSMK